MQRIKQCLMALICIAFVLAPLQRASAAMHLQANLGSGQSDDINRQETAHLHGGEIESNSSTGGQQCCSSDHSNMAGGFCADCLVFALVNSPINEKRIRQPVPLVHSSSGQSRSVVGDTPVPKI